MYEKEAIGALFIRGVRHIVSLVPGPRLATWEHNGLFRVFPKSIQQYQHHDHLFLWW